MDDLLKIRQAVKNGLRRFHDENMAIDNNVEPLAAIRRYTQEIV
jgi:hypothetical protein